MTLSEISRAIGVPKSAVIVGGLPPLLGAGSVSLTSLADAT